MSFVSLDFFSRPVDEVARDLIGRTLLVAGPDSGIEAVIVETEAYGGPEDPASHAAFKPRGGARIMFEGAGLVYVFLAYGMYPCLNVVTGNAGEASAVLFRGALVGEERTPILGPGRLGRALGVTNADNGLTCAGPKYRISESRHSYQVTATPRIGITRAVATPWRFLASFD